MSITDDELHQILVEALSGPVASHLFHDLIQEITAHVVVWCSGPGHDVEHRLPAVQHLNAVMFRLSCRRWIVAHAELTIEERAGAVLIDGQKTANERLTLLGKGMTSNRLRKPMRSDPRHAAGGAATILVAVDVHPGATLPKRSSMGQFNLT